MNTPGKKIAERDYWGGKKEPGAQKISKVITVYKQTQTLQSQKGLKDKKW